MKRMNGIKFVGATVLVAMMMSAVGCEAMSFFKKDKDKDDAPKVEKTESKPQPTAEKPAPKATTKPVANKVDRDFQGYYLKVNLDGGDTKPLQVVAGQQVWTAPGCGTTPSLTFIYDKKTLGKFKSVTLGIRPIVNGRIPYNVLWQYSGAKELRPGETVKLDRFTRIADNKITRDIKALPAGRYRLNFLVKGENNWDRQYIDVDVK